jgi:hypothetical protein
MYTDTMRRAFKSLEDYCPRGFGVQLVDNQDFISIRVRPDALDRLSHDDKIAAVEYIFRVKDALEQNGAIVLVVRTPIDTPPLT